MLEVFVYIWIAHRWRAILLCFLRVEHCYHRSTVHDGTPPSLHKRLVAIAAGAFVMAASITSSVD